VKKYAEAPLKAGAARATIDRERAALRRAIQLGIDDELICVPLPKFGKLPENNVRTGFIEQETYHAILVHLPDPPADGMVLRLPARDSQRRAVEDPHRVGPPVLEAGRTVHQNPSLRL
jgi:hypothetical protein